MFSFKTFFKYFSNIALVDELCSKLSEHKTFQMQAGYNLLIQKGYDNFDEILQAKA